MNMYMNFKAENIKYQKHIKKPKWPNVIFAVSLGPYCESNIIILPQHALH